MGGVRELAVPFVVPGPCGVAVRDRLGHLTSQDEMVLRAVGEHQGALASRDLKARCADGLEHSADTWALRKRDLTKESSSRIAGAITKATHDQWALARRGQAAHMKMLEAGIRMLRHRLSLPIGEKGTKRAAGGYRSQSEWFRKSRRLAALEARHAAAVAEWQAGRVRVVRGGKRLLNTRHHLAEARLTEGQWRERWEAERWFIGADGESGKRFGNETIRVTPDGEVSIRLPAPLAGRHRRRLSRPPGRRESGTGESCSPSSPAPSEDAAASGCRRGTLSRDRRTRKCPAQPEGPQGTHPHSPFEGGAGHAHGRPSRGGRRCGDPGS
ncbi:hypothetical protein GCM10018966_027920 [Streptomyces yanii]